jgi:hypothetical protein
MDTPMGERIAATDMGGWVGPWRVWRRDIAVATLIGVFLGALGPFGSFLNGGVGVRLAYWVLVSLLALAIFGLGLRWALREGTRRKLPDWLVLTASVAILCVPFSVVVSIVAEAVWSGVRRYVQPLDWYWQSLVISLPISVVWQTWERKRSRPVVALSNADDSAAAPALLDSVLLGAGVICLQMEDHYVRIHTGGGSKLVLSPLSTAIRAMHKFEGAQIHRSWWVARDHVVRPVWVGRTLQLELANGLRAPVSRGRVATLRALGWLG